MLTHHRKHLILVSIRGVLLAMLAVILQWGGYLTHVESLLYDERVRHCQAFRPPPTPSLVHLDVDDNALEYIGRWPWAPTKLARMIDEIALTKPKVLAMDVLFAEPKGIVYGKNDSVGVDEDQQLAAALHRLNCAVIPVSLHFENSGPPSALRQLLLPLLIENPELTKAQCFELLASRGVNAPDPGADDSDSFLQILQQAFYERIWRELLASKDMQTDSAVLKRRLLPHADPLLTGTVLGNLFDDEFNLVSREKTMLRFTLPARPGLPPLLKSSQEVPPILPIGQAAAYSGFVDYLPESVEGTVRSVPLLVEYHGQMVPQMGLVTACADLGVDIHTLRLTADSVTLPMADGHDIVIPVSVRRSTIVGSVGMLMEVPLFGKPGNWLTMYDYPSYQKPAQHVSVYDVWKICQTREKLERNQAPTDRKLLESLNLTDPDNIESYAAALPTGEAKILLIHKTQNDTSEFIRNLSANAELDPETVKLLQHYKTVDGELRLLVEQNEKLEAQLTQQRGDLRNRLHNRAIFFGGTATSLSDLRPTSLFGSSPGVVVHGAVYNAILTRKMWRLTSPALGLAITAVIGLVTLALVMTLPPVKACVASLGLLLGYLAFNGFFLFARENLIVAAAGPAIAVGLVLSGMTLANFLTEIAERSRITRRFRSYVDPSLVDWMVDHPENLRFDGERREMTVAFSDLAGFTTLTDQLGERIVPLLAEYMGKMVPVIRGHKGHVAQLLGDGIYFFFGAPQPDHEHAVHAVSTALQMHEALGEFNATLRERGFSTLGMRIGLSTGEVIVGDAGTEDACAYTAMGPTTNLAARLESANKFFGTRTLITARTVELLYGEYLVRPIANLRVAGKLNCMVVYEPLCLISQATDEDRQLADCTAHLFQAYRSADFQACIDAALEMELVFGASKLTKLYTRQSNDHLDGTATRDHCEGEIVLTEK